MRKRKIALFAFLIFATTSALAQFTTVTGTVVDPHNVPYALGTIAPHLVATGTTTLNGQSYAPPSGPVNLDNNGHFAFNVADNTVLKPSGSQWYFTICSANGTVNPAVGTGSQCFNITPLTISGSTQDISTQINAVAPALTVPLGNSGCTPAGLNQIQYNNAGACAGIANAAPGSALVSQGTGAPPAQQQKPLFDLRDFTKPLGLQCDGSTDVTAAVLAAQTAFGSNPASLRFVLDSTNTGPCNLDSIGFSGTTTLDFMGGGAIKPITDTTPAGGGGFDQSGSGGTSCGPSASTCSVTVTPSAANETYALILFCGFGACPAGVNRPTSSVTSDFIPFLPNLQSTQNRSSNINLWLIPNVVAGSHTFTTTTPGSGPIIVQALAITGVGKTPQLDGPGTFSYGNNSPMSSGAYTLLSGDFVLSFGGTNSNAETCTAGAGFTQPTGNAGNLSGASWSNCTQYQASSSAGSLTATQSISSTPTTNAWVYGIVGIRPGSAQVYIAGGINNPDSHQIFYNATGNAGQIFFLGNTSAYLRVPPDWWGGSATAAGSVNNGPVQAAITSAIGSGLPQYNKVLDLSRGIYNLSAESKWYGVRGNQTSRFTVDCGSAGGLNQQTSNLRVRDSQSMSYGNFFNCQWSKTATDTTYTAVDDIDNLPNAVPGAGPPQFLSFYDNGWLCTGSTTAPSCDVGLLGAKSGGPNFSNIKWSNPSFQGFSGAGLQVGGDNTGRNAGRMLAQNALSLSIINGDFQNCPLYGIATYGAGFVETHNTSFECTSPWASYLTALGTAVDQICSAPQGPCIMDHVRSEDLQMLWSATPVINDSQNTDQSSAWYTPAGACLPGTTLPLNFLFHGSDIGGTGALYRVTASGTGFGGTCLTFASSGSGTTIVAGTQTIPGANTIGTFTFLPAPETVTQAVSGASATLVRAPVSVGTITGSVTSGTIVASHTVTQTGTGITCTVLSPAPTLSANLLVNNCSGTANNSGVWTDSGGGTYTPSSAPSFAAANPTLIVGAITGTPDAIHNWTGSLSGAVYVPSGSPTNTNNFTSNQFVASAPGQMQVTIWAGTGKGETCGPITSNTSGASTITCGNTWTTTFANVTTPVSPDATSQFIIEPYWAANPTTSGDVTFNQLNPIIIGGDTAGLNSSSCDIRSVSAHSGFIQCQPQFSHINGLFVTRPDWLHGASGFFSDTTMGWDLDNVQVTRVYSSLVGSLNWTIANRNGSPTTYTGALQHQIGTKPLISTAGNVPAGRNLNDVGILGRSYATGISNSLAQSTFLNMVEVFGGTIGPSAPAQTVDANGNLMRIIGGPPRGAGTPGNACIATGQSGSSGINFSDGLDRWCVNGSTGTLAAQNSETIQPALYATKTNCAQSGTAANPSVVSCSAAPAGAFACNVAASAGTCVVNTTAVGANSEIIVQETSKENTRLGVTCNTSPTVIPAIIVASQVNGTSFTINMPTITTNPACFDYWIVNQ